MYIIDRLEHGNMGVHGTEVLFRGLLSECLKKKPSDFGVYRKEWGFWPVIARRKDGDNDYSYAWDDGEWDGKPGEWVKRERKKKSKHKK